MVVRIKEGLFPLTGLKDTIRETQSAASLLTQTPEVPTPTALTLSFWALPRLNIVADYGQNKLLLSYRIRSF